MRFHRYHLVQCRSWWVCGVSLWSYFLNLFLILIQNCLSILWIMNFFYSFFDRLVGFLMTLAVQRQKSWSSVFYCCGCCCWWASWHKRLEQLCCYFYFSQFHRNNWTVFIVLSIIVFNLYQLILIILIKDETECLVKDWR